MTHFRARGIAYLEVMVVIAILAVLAGLIVMPAYRSYAAARAPKDAATTLSEDLALLERTAQNSKPDVGSSLIIVSDDPLHYQCYVGRPAGVDPKSSLQYVMIDRSFNGVVLASGPINSNTPLLFAGNGSAQFVTNQMLASQHQVIQFGLSQGATQSPNAFVELNLFTGSIQAKI